MSDHFAESVAVERVTCYVGHCPRCAYESMACEDRYEADGAVRIHIELVHNDGSVRDIKGE